MKYKIGKSKIEGAGKGLLVKKAYREGEIIGLAHIDDQPATSIGKFHNHSEEPTAGSIKIDNRRYLVAMRDLEPGDEITTDYRQQPELEQPEDFKRGGSTKLPKMPKPSKKGVLAKGYSRSLEATNRLFTENKLFARPKSRKRKVFDPGANYEEGGSLPKAEYGMPLGAGMSQNYQGRKKFIHQDGGEPKKKKRKTDDYGRYRSEDGNVRTPITPEMQAVMPPDEWGQYVQDVPEVYTTRTKEQQDIRNALDYQQRMAGLYPGRPTQSDAIQPANWVFAAPMVAPMALEALGSVAATQIPGTGVSLGTVANTGFGIHGATQVPQRIQDWQDVAAGKKDWREATAESLMTGLELYGGLSELKGFKGVPKELPGSPNNTANIQKAGFLNPFELADEVVPNLDPFQVTTANSLLDLSPLNIVPIGKKLATKGNAYRKFGNTMKYVQESKSLSPKGGILPRIGKKQIEAEGNWAALNEPWEKYPGAFTAEFDFKVPGSNLGYSNPSSRAGVLITDASGKALPEIPLTDPGLSFHRRLPFSNRYIPIDKQKLLDNKFQMATQGAHLQSLAEKYGYGLAYAGLLGAMGNDEAVKTYNKYTIDPVIKEAKKLIKQDSKKYQEGGIISQEEIDAGNRAMMKARLAYAQMHGNPAAQRMVVAPDQPYDFGNGMTGTHYMASMDDYAVPQIQEQNGVLELGDYSPNSNEAIRFDTPEDAEYFAENYKQVSPAFEAELTEEEIEEYRRGGWIVEEC
jgi:hypothetical protein